MYTLTRAGRPHKQQRKMLPIDPAKSAEHDRLTEQMLALVQASEAGRRERENWDGAPPLEAGHYFDQATRTWRNDEALGERRIWIWIAGGLVFPKRDPEPVPGLTELSDRREKLYKEILIAANRCSNCGTAPLMRKGHWLCRECWC